MKNYIVSCFAVIAYFGVLCHTDSNLGIQKNMDEPVVFMVPTHQPGVNSDGIAFIVPTRPPGGNANGVEC